MKLPDTPQPGSPPAPAVWYRQTVDFLRRLAARVAALEAAGRGSSSVTTGTTAPWRLRGFIDTGPTAKITVAPGVVNNAVPNIGGTSLAAAPRPELTVTGASGSVYLKATVDAAGAITALVIESASSIPADTSTDKHKLIGTWTASGGAFTSVTSILNTNQTLYLCNGTAIWEA